MARLDTLQKKALKEATKDIDADIFLFGSRVDDTKKGGDVDILITTNNIKNKLKLKLKVISRYQNICNEKIDVIIMPQEKKMNTREKSFFNIIKKVKIGTII